MKMLKSPGFVLMIGSRSPSDVPSRSDLQSTISTRLILEFPNQRCVLLRSASVSLRFLCSVAVIGLYFRSVVSPGSSTPGDSISFRALFLISRPLACVINFPGFNGVGVITRLRRCF